MAQRNGLSHIRSPLVYAGAVVFAAALLVLAPRVGSRIVSVGAGIAAGGALATAVAGLLWWGQGVPDPLVRDGVAFNLADVAIAAGDALLIGGVLLHAWRNRTRLGEAL